MVIHFDWAFHSSTRSGPNPRRKGEALRMVMVLFLARSHRRTWGDNAEKGISEKRGSERCV